MTLPLSTDELDTALIKCIGYVQRSAFFTEIAALNRGQAVGKRSPLHKLQPFLDPHGLLRVGGRLHQAQLPYTQRHPAILPKKCHLGRMIIEKAHKAAMHGGPGLTYSYAIRTTWLIGGRAQVRAFVRSCITCARARARPSTQEMGDLPSARINPSRPFSHTGLDYAGPFMLKASNRRGVASTKGYIAIFVCLCTKAIHIEVVGDLTTASFLAALRHFSSRRGTPTELWSDNATTFHGADAALRSIFREARHDHQLIQTDLANRGIRWRFIPPAAPHFGGLWEAAVKSAKTHLKKVVGQRLLTYEEMSTLTTQIELCLNSRPLTPMTGDVEDLRVLTPGHLLTGFQLNTLPEPVDANRGTLDCLTHWNLVQGMRNQFWTQWARDYLHTLQQRLKWQQPRDNLKVDDLVVVLDATLLQNGRWPLGRIISAHPGPDGRVRVATVRTSTGEYTRPIVKLAHLPLPT